MAVSRFGADLIKRGLRSPYLVLLFGASVLLSMASFWTTFLGLVAFVQPAIFALFITMAIQVLLFVVAWRLGFMYADKENIAWADVLIFVVCLMLSVFFSFSSLFDVVYTPERQADASQARVRDSAAEAVNGAEETLKALLATRTEELAKSTEYQVWRTGLLKIADLAQGSGPAMREQLERQRSAQQEEYQRLVQAATDLAARRGTIQNDITRAHGELERLQARRPALAESVATLEGAAKDLEDQLVQKQSERDSEERGIGDSGKAGRGKKWNVLDQEYKKLQARAAVQGKRLQTEQGRLADLDRSLVELNAQLTRDQGLFENFDAEIQAARNRAKIAGERLAALGSGGSGVDASVQQLRSYPTEFETSHDLSRLVQAEMLCNQLYDNMKAVPTLAPALAALSCDRGVIASRVAQIEVLDAAQARLDAACTGAEAPSMHELGAAAALSHARDCLDLSKLPYKALQRERARLDRLQREEIGGVSPFTKTTNALLSGERLAYLALLIAAAMDLLVLFTGLIGAKSASTTFRTRVLEPVSGDRPEVLAIKALLANVVAYNEKREDGVRYEGKVDLGSVQGERERDLASQLLNINAASGMVLRDPEQADLYYLRHGCLEQLDEQLQKSEQRDAAAAAALVPPPSPVPAAAEPVPRRWSEFFQPHRDSGSGAVTPAPASARAPAPPPRGPARASAPAFAAGVAGGAPQVESRSNALANAGFGFRGRPVLSGATLAPGHAPQAAASPAPAASRAPVSPAPPLAAVSRGGADDAPVGGGPVAPAPTPVSTATVARVAAVSDDDPDLAYRFLMDVEAGAGRPPQDQG